jgi:hypothetical protein
MLTGLSNRNGEEVKSAGLRTNQISEEQEATAGFLEKEPIMKKGK